MSKGQTTYGNESKSSGQTKAANESKAMMAEQKNWTQWEAWKQTRVSGLRAVVTIFALIIYRGKKSMQM